MSLITHVHIPAAWGMPDTDLVVETTGWKNPKATAAKIFRKMVEAVDTEGRFEKHFKYGLPPACTFKTDKQSVINCRNELLGVLRKYSARLEVSYDSNEEAVVRMGVECVLVLDEGDLD